ncbi:TRAP transporter solute receptor, TAXI family precursor [Geomicrobium sp. JCM 19037]|uniref:TAXI family TRAP transporter solute-binding subunit n=1 Tax=unclassified Geomicrobium TaxID=2628951 RepID=UPI00045F4C84|nr:TAXI family TRAP transporter solute-binding subunit [Geomicrobium sp. JCM 19037]GAK04909.1 TRAP transporter solute receptor, TAXI family precursor [Geomicrobium sp. JCM 19037]
MKKLKMFTLASVLPLLLLSACGEESSGGDAEGEFQELDYPSTVTIGTASQGGTYYIWGGAFSSLLEDHLDITSNVEVTGGPVHNIQLLGAGDAHLGMTTVGPLFEGYYGEGAWVGDEPYEDIRVIFPMYTTPFHWWSLENTGVDNIQEHAGQRVGVGPSGGTPGEYNPQIYDALGIETGDQVQAGASDMTSQMLDGQLSHIGFSAGIPISAVTEVEAQASINIYGIDGEDRETVMEALPYFTEYVIPGDTYGQLDGDLETIGMYNFGVVQREANADFVYDLVKAYHENIDQIISVHQSAEEAQDPEAILMNEEYPMHVGAIRYYEEIGIDLPDEVYPEEYESSEE